MFYQTAPFDMNELVELKTSRRITNGEISFIITVVWLTIIHKDVKNKRFDLFDDGSTSVVFDPPDFTALDTALDTAPCRMQLVTSKIPQYLFYPPDYPDYPADEKKPLYSSHSGVSLRALAFFRMIGVGCKDIMFNMPCLFAISYVSFDETDIDKGFIYTCHFANNNFYNFAIYKTETNVYLFLPISGEYMCEVYTDFKEMEWQLQKTLLDSLNEWISEYKKNPILHQITCDIKEIIFS